ncbi:TonB family protein [Methylopila sp. M107]|uniref:TonB family protein n=1 Tax=Methylopila sp. M107 TaxID=1101190 RepID=UPI0003A76648|nr:TonB family protein [Methylopila sp. M107]
MPLVAFLVSLLVYFVFVTLISDPGSRPEEAQPSEEPIASDCDYGCRIRTAVNRRRNFAAYESAGRVVVRFEVRRSGELVQVAVDPGSATPALERAAIAMIQDASRSFPPFPPDMEAEERSFSLPISFYEQTADR